MWYFICVSLEGREATTQLSSSILHSLNLGVKIWADEYIFYLFNVENQFFQVKDVEQKIALMGCF